MTYVILSNRTKDGYPLTDLFKIGEKTIKTPIEFKEDMPFVQMARFVQVRCLNALLQGNIFNLLATIC